MSKVVTTTVLPDVAGGSVTLGGTGDSVVATGNDIRTNALQDAGGNAVFTSDGSGVLSGMNSAFSGALNLLSTQTASGAASVEFTSGIASTYDVYCFKFFDINPTSTSNAIFQFQANVSGASGFNETITSTYFKAYHDEGGSATALTYDSGEDQAQGTAYQNLANSVGSGSDECAVGQLYLFSPSSTTYVKHFYTEFQYLHASDYSQHHFCGGYFNVTGAITQLSFKFNSGLFDGTIKLYGISKS